MSEDQKRQLETQLWGIANLLRGKISADDYRDYILGFIFYKYLSEKQNIFANNLLETENFSLHLLPGEMRTQKQKATTFLKT